MAREDPARLRGRPGAARRVGLGARRGARPSSTTARCAASRACSPSAARRSPRSRASSPPSGPSTAHLLARRRDGGQPGRPGGLAQAGRLPADACSSPARCESCSSRCPASTPLELRDRAMFELAYSAGLRAEELVNLDLERWTPTPRSCAWRARAGARGSCPPASRPGRRIESYLDRGRPELATEPAERALFLSQDRPAAVHLRRAPPAERRRRGARRSRPASRLTRCATRSRPICWRAAPTCGPSRSCSATPPSLRPRPTLG